MANTVERFTNRVENYVKYRPTYPKEVVQLLKDEMNLTVSSVIADVGSGTGISSKLFLEYGNAVLGVEPNAAMRSAAENFLADFSNFKSVNGTAENTGLSDDSVDFVVAAQAFHWFDREGTRAEFRRILQPIGFIVLMWNERQLDTTPFLREYERFLLTFANDYTAVRHENITADVLEEFFQSGFSKKTFENTQVLDFDGLKGRMLSSSYMPSESDARYGLMNETLRELFKRHASDGKIKIIYDTNIFYTQV